MDGIDKSVHDPNTRRGQSRPGTTYQCRACQLLRLHKLFLKLKKHMAQSPHHHTATKGGTRGIKMIEGALRPLTTGSSREVKHHQISLKRRSNGPHLVGRPKMKSDSGAIGRAMTYS